MNYFELYPGDYLRDTAELTLAEHGSFLLLLAAYYGSERPIPSDNPTLFRLVRAMTDDEKNAVIRVSELFFPISSLDGLRHNKRADEEIVKARARIEAARENGRNGGRPKKPSNNPMGFNPLTHREPIGVPNTKALHAPHAIEEQDQKKEQPSVKPKAKESFPSLPDWVSGESWDGFVEMRKNLRFPLTPRAAKLIIGELGKLRDIGHNPATVLDQSTRNSWRDVFPVKGESAKTSSVSPNNSVASSRPL